MVGRIISIIKIIITQVCLICPIRELYKSHDQKYAKNVVGRVLISHNNEVMVSGAMKVYCDEIKLQSL